MHGSLVLCVLSPYIQGLFGQHHATLNIWLRTVVRLTGEREHAKAKLEVKGYAFLESLEQNWAGPQLLNAGAWVSVLTYRAWMLQSCMHVDNAAMHGK